MSADTDLSYIAEKIKQDEVNDLKNSGFISDITNRKFEFATVIESLGSILTNQDVTIRERGVNFLSWILTEVSTDLFNSREISAIVSFYCDRLKDHPTVASATINGLLALVKMKNIEDKSIIHILMPLFRETDCQILDKSDRFNILSIVAYLIENHFDVVVAMGFDFVFGIISVADGETDPTNLSLLFRFLPAFLKNIDLGHLMEETFDLLSCYFPIDYDTALKNSSVSRQDLSEGLMNCLIARPDFSDLCIPLILEKLTSSIKTSKVDSYMLLVAGCSTFSAESVSKYASDVWKTIQKDVLPPVDSHVRDSALNALSEVVKLFASSESEQQLLKNFLDDIMTSIREFLNDVGHNLFRPAMNVLMAVCSKSPQATKYVIGHIKSIFTEETNRTVSLKRTALLSLAPFLPTLKACEIARSDEPDLVNLFNELSKFYMNSIGRESDETQKLALSGLQELVEDFDDNLLNELLKAILEAVTPLWNENWVEFHKLLRHLARIGPSKMLDFVQNFEIRRDFDNQPDPRPLMFTICAIASEETITQYAIPKLINIMNKTDYLSAGISYLLNSVKLVNDNQFLRKIHMDYNFTEAIITGWVNGAEKNSIDMTYIGVWCEMIALLVRCQESSIQQSIIDRFIPLLLPGVESGKCERNLFLIEAILNSVQNIEKFDQLPLLGQKAISLAVQSNEEEVRLSSSRLLASIANKMSKNLPEWLTKSCDEIFLSLDDTTPILERQNTAWLLCWLVKGLVLADSPYLRSFIPKWFDLLEREDVGPQTTQGFKTILEEEDLYLNIESHCNVQLLYRQHFFTYFPLLMNKYESSKSPCKRNYLLALIQLIKAVPKHVSASEITNIVIVLSETLDTGCVSAIFICTKILEEYLKDKETIFVNYVYTFIPKLLNLAQLHGHMEIRMSALKCLFFYAFYPTVYIIPLRREVIKSLKACVDDRKRLVRYEAVRSRNRWFLVGAPGEDDIFS